MRKWYVVLIALAVIAVAWGIGARLFVAQKSNVPESPLASVSMAYYTNAQGQKWGIPTGDYNFTVTSAEDYPKFVLGSINPVKVSIGQHQTMQIIIRDNVPLTKVWAEVENDNGTDHVTLTPGASSTVSYSTIENQKYLVDNNGKLVINDGSSPSIVAAVVQSLFNKAEAEQAVDYSYSGTWQVHDTRNITYHTVFYAEDALGRTKQLTLAWSDPSCTTNGSGVLSGACSLTSPWGLDGTINGGNLNLSVYTVTMSSGGALVYNSGKSITISTGQIVGLTASTPIVKANLYYTDADGDGYAPNNIMSYNTASSWSGHIRVSSAMGTNDCNDTNSVYGAGANPGDVNWWVGTGGSGWTGTAGDYNCNGTLEGGWVLQTGATNYSPSAVQATVSPWVVCTAYMGSAFYTNGGGTPNYACGTGPAYNGSVFYVGSGGGCNGGLTYMGWGTPVSVCR